MCHPYTDITKHSFSPETLEFVSPIDTARGYKRLLKLKGYDLDTTSSLGGSQGIDLGITKLAKELGL